LSVLVSTLSTKKAQVVMLEQFKMAERTGFETVNTILLSMRSYPLFRCMSLYSTSIKDL